MLPTLELSPASLLLSFVATTALALAVHELGHAVAGALAGFRIVACGIGIHKPFFVRRLFGVSFYVARPLTVGLTLGVRERFDTPRGALMTFQAGGIAANFLSAAAALALWSAGVHGSFLAVFFYGSLILGASNALPFHIRRRGATLRSDGLVILHHLRRISGSLQTPAEMIVTTRILGNLCRAIGADHGTVAYTLHLALAQIGAHEPEEANKTLLDPCLQLASRGSFALGMELLVKAHARAAAKALDTEEAITAAFEACKDDVVAVALLRLLRAQLAREAQREDAGELAREARASVPLPRMPDLATLADALVLQANPLSESAPAECRRIVALLRARPGLRAAAAQLLVAMTRRLVATGRIEDARPLFAEALSQVQAASADLPSEAARRRYFEEASAALKEAVAGAGDAIPLFMEMKPIAPEKRDRLSSARKGALGVLALAAAVTIAALVTSRRADDDLAAMTDATLMDEALADRVEDDVATLEALRTGDKEPAIDLLEEEIDSVALGERPGQRGALARARAYRAAHPRTTDDPEHDAKVRKALGLTP